MASTYSSLKIELIGTGEQDGTWGNTTNTNLGTTIEQAITGTGDVTFTSADVTLTLTNSNSAQVARNLRLVLVGTSGGARQLIVPAIEKQYIIKNELADAVTVKNSSGTGIAVPSGATAILFNDGTNVVPAITSTSSMALSGALTLGGAITGTTATFSGAISSVSPAFTGTPTAPTAAAGTDTTQIATTAFVLANGAPTGSMMMWATGTAPSGWLLCEGDSISTSTYAALFAVIGYTFGGSGASFLLPNYRNRFPVGAGDSYVVGGTGGSKDAITVSHTHTLTDPGHVHTLQDTNSRGITAPGGGVIGGSSNTPPAAPSNNNFIAALNAVTGVTVDSAGSSGTNANLPPYLGIRFIIKT
jgi:microcystin-dependent protein